MTEVAIFRGRAVTFTEPLSRPVGTSRDFGTKTHTHNALSGGLFGCTGRPTFNLLSPEQ